MAFEGFGRIWSRAKKRDPLGPLLFLRQLDDVAMAQIPTLNLDKIALAAPSTGLTAVAVGKRGIQPLVVRFVRLYPSRLRAHPLSGGISSWQLGPR